MTEVETTISLLRKYCKPFGTSATTFTKSSIVQGAPGSGKSHVILYLSLCAMSMGLRVMTTALMGVSANALGGIHIHKLFGMWPNVGRSPSLRITLCVVLR